MGLFDRFKSQPEEVVKKKRSTKSHALHRVRRFEAAKSSRTLMDWVINTINDFDEELKADLPALRARSRDASINDVYARRYLKSLVNNVVGDSGIQLKMSVRNARNGPNTTANNLIESAWKDYCKDVSVTGQAFVDVERLIMEQVARDGEIFVIVHKGPQFGKYKIQLQLLQAEYIDENYSNVELGNGNHIIHGIEYNEYGRAIAYHFYRRHPTLYHRPIRSEDRMRILADNVFHIYERERTEHGRGFPWLSSALILLTQLKEYRKSELVAARIASAKMGFYTRPKGENELGEGVDEDDRDALITEVEPGMFDILPEGYDLTTFDPQNPNGNFGDFQKTILRGVASSVGISYHTLTSDLENVNYSSLRQGAIDERDTYRSLQQWLIRNLHVPLFEKWLEMSLSFNTIGYPLSLSQYNRINAPTWRPRSWAWVDPAKEVTASKFQIEKGLRSRTDIARSLGNEFEDVLVEIAAENAYADSLGIDLNAANKSEIAPINDEPNDEPNEEVNQEPEEA